MRRAKEYEIAFACTTRVCGRFVCERPRKIPGFGGIGGKARLLDNRFQVTIVTLHCTIWKKGADEHVCMSNIIGGGLTM